MMIVSVKCYKGLDSFLVTVDLLSNEFNTGVQQIFIDLEKVCIGVLAVLLVQTSAGVDLTSTVEEVARTKCMNSSGPVDENVSIDYEEDDFIHGEIFLNGKKVDEVDCSRLDEYSFTKSSSGFSGDFSAKSIVFLLFLLLLVFSPLLTSLGFYIVSGSTGDLLKILAVSWVSPALFFLLGRHNLFFLLSKSFGGISDYIPGGFLLAVVFLLPLYLLYRLFRDMQSRKERVWLIAVYLSVIISSAMLIVFTTQSL